MSGKIFMSSEVPVDIESSKWNPLQCNICTEQYLDPCILQCYHSFCTRCVEGRIEDGQITCPVCGAVTVIKEDCTVPPPDPLLKFLVESSSPGDKIQCANCDQTDKQLFFCNTCTQPLCVTCREDTHRAKMFQTHDVVMLTKHSRDIQKQCKIHGEPFILFSTEKKLMLCINCFRDMKVESRSHCVDLETAYKQGCQKLDDTMQSIRDLQNSVRDGILLLRALLEEIESNAEQEKQDIVKLYDTMQEQISQMKDSLLKEIDSQYDEKLELFKNQLISLTTFLPTLHVHLVTCAAFFSSANKYEFLDFTYVLMKRLTAIIQVQHPLHPSQTSDIVTEYKAKFAKCLEPLLFPHRNSGTSMSVPTSMASSVTCTRYDNSPSISTMTTSRPGMDLSSLNHPGVTRYNHNKTAFKLKLMETKGFFSDHCKEFDDAHRKLMHKVEGLKLSMQEVQRDLTLRRSLTKDAAITDLKTKISLTEDLLDIHQDHVQGKQDGLEKHWEEALERIAGEQDVYKAQLQDVCRLKSEIVTVKTILDKLSSFISSIANVTQRLAPKLSKATNVAEQDDQHAALLHEISTVQPDSKQRVSAIKTAQEERDIKTANRTNPLDVELIKTKGLLRAPSARKDSSKRSSAEMWEVLDVIAEYNAELDRAELEKKGADSRSQVKSNESNPESESYEVFSDVNETVEVTEPKEIKTRETADLNGANTDSNAHTDKDTIKSNTGSFETKVNTSCSDDKETDNAPICVTIPDIALQTCETKSSIDILVANLKVIHDESVENGAITEDISFDTASESDFDTSLDSTISSDDSVKPGLVRDIIAKVDGISKGVDENKCTVTDKNVKPSGDCQEQNGACGLGSNQLNYDEGSSVNGDMEKKHTQVSSSKEDRISKQSDVNGTEYDRVNKFVAVDKDESINQNMLKVDDSQNSPGKSENSSVKSENSPVKCENSPLKYENGVENSDEEVYVTKSLPELAQVFEPGELKQKKRRGKGDKNKGTKEK